MRIAVACCTFTFHRLDRCIGGLRLIDCAAAALTPAPPANNAAQQFPADFLIVFEMDQSAYTETSRLFTASSKMPMGLATADFDTDQTPDQIGCYSFKLRIVVRQALAMMTDMQVRQDV